MALIILDAGSGNTCKNDGNYIKKMIDELVKVDTGKHEVVIKWQLFRDAPPNTRLDYYSFDFAYKYAKSKGYKTTASVFDKRSLSYLLHFDIPFVKIANRPDLYWLAGEVPRKIPVYTSVGVKGKTVWVTNDWINTDIETLACVSEYPATFQQYEEKFGSDLGYTSLLYRAISDHTTNFDLWHKYSPKIIEWHYKLADSTGLDAGEFARTPEQLKAIL